MFRLLSVFLILAGAVFANGTCNCPPSVIVSVNGFSYSSSFSPTTTDGGLSYTIRRTITNDNSPDEGAVYTGGAFTFSLDVTTHPDPNIDLDTSIEGDPTVGIRITQTFLGGPLFDLVTASAGTIQDLGGNGSASALGSPFIQTTTVGGVVVQQNTGCDLALETSAPTSCGASSLTTQRILIPSLNPFIPPSGVMVMDIGFILSDNDKYSLHSSVTLSPVPEPAAAIPMAVGLLAMAGIVWRRKRNRLDLLG